MLEKGEIILIWLETMHLMNLMNVQLQNATTQGLDKEFEIFSLFYFFTLNLSGVVLLGKEIEVDICSLIR